MAKEKETHKEMNITDKVMLKVSAFEKAGSLKLPKDYSAANAIRSAYLMLQETVDKDKEPVLEVCTQVSIASSLFDMVVQGLNPMKKQCYFIAYDKKLSMKRSYQGAIMVAKRVGMKTIIPNVIYEGDKDKFKYKIDPLTGRKSIIEHTQELENIDENAIIGAYAIIVMEDDTVDIDIMSIKQIKASWLMGQAKGNSLAHQNFGSEMCKRTVINRATKSIINSSDDGSLYEGETQTTQKTIEEANTEDITFDDVIDVKEELPQGHGADEKTTKEKTPKNEPVNVKEYPEAKENTDVIHEKKEQPALFADIKNTTNKPGF